MPKPEPVPKPEPKPKPKPKPEPKPNPEPKPKPNPTQDNSFDIVTNVVSIDYLTQPLQVLQGYDIST